MNKKASMDMSHLLAAILVIIVVVIILIAMEPFFASMLDAIGFDVGRPSEHDEEAAIVFDEFLIESVNDCRNSDKIDCFCNTSLLAQNSLPNNYQLIFSQEYGNTKVVLKNDKGGTVENKVFPSIEPCIINPDGIAVAFSEVVKNSAMITISSEDSLNYELLDGGEFHYPVDKSKLFYLKNKNTLCMVDLGYPTKPMCS